MNDCCTNLGATSYYKKTLVKFKTTVTANEARFLHCIEVGGVNTLNRCFWSHYGMPLIMQARCWCIVS